MKYKKGYKEKFLKSGMRNAMMFVFGFVLAFVLVAGVVCAAGPGMPHAFFGEVSYSNGGVVNGGAIVAEIGGDVVGSSEEGVSFPKTAANFS